jgi:hypothetical protein
VRALIHNEHEMKYGPMCVCQWLPREEFLAPVDIKMESPTKEMKKRFGGEESREYRNAITRERRRIENYGRLD